MNAGKSKVMLFERGEAEVMNFSIFYTVGRCEVLLGERIEEVKDCNYSVIDLT